jgi:hypothetical protein
VISYSIYLWRQPFTHLRLTSSFFLPEQLTLLRTPLIGVMCILDCDRSNLQKRLEQLAPTTLNLLETLPVLSPTGAAKINAHVPQADIVHVHTLWSPLNLSARYACLRHDRPYVLMLTVCSILTHCRSKR